MRTSGATRRLPTTVQLRVGEALDGYLERVADANYLNTAQLMATITANTDTTCCLMLAPTPLTLDVLSKLTNTSPQRLRQATLVAYDGPLLNFTGLDPARPASFRTVSARGWYPGRGTQICPLCLDETGMWALVWRLPTTTVCRRHGTYLLSTCPNCHRRFRDQHHSHLRSVGSATACGNPLGNGPRAQCQTDLASLNAPEADSGCLARQERQDHAQTGRPVVTAFGELSGNEYCSSLRALTIVLLHIATAATDTRHLPDWAAGLNREQAARAPRWGIKPPQDTVLRSRALTTADTILSATDMGLAVHRLARWLNVAPSVPEGRLGWLSDHAKMTPTLTRLLTNAHLPRRRVSQLLDTHTPMTSCLCQIPQVLPRIPYVEHLHGLFACRPETVRLFASLSIARTHPTVRSWMQAAAALGLSDDVGSAAARACSARRKAVPQKVVTAIGAAANELHHRDYRVLEIQVRRLARTSRWFTRWAGQYRPVLPVTHRDIAVLWLWVYRVHAHLRSAPLLVERASQTQIDEFDRFLTSEQRTSPSDLLRHAPRLTDLGDLNDNACHHPAHRRHHFRAGQVFHGGAGPSHSEITRVLTGTGYSDDDTYKPGVQGPNKELLRTLKRSHGDGCSPRAGLPKKV